MSFFLNRTEHYHKKNLENLNWEVTVCNSIEADTSPIRQILVNNRTYGEQLFDYLFEFISKERCSRVMEVGGGYGFLMRDLLRHVPDINATMVDISPAMMTRQRQILEGFHVRFLQSDFF